MFWHGLHRSMTTLSFTMKKFYEKFLLAYERVSSLCLPSMFISASGNASIEQGIAGIPSCKVLIRLGSAGNEGHRH